MNWDYRAPLHFLDEEIETLEQRSPTPGPWTAMGPRPVRSRATQQEASDRQAKLHLPLPVAPHRSPLLTWSPEPSHPPHRSHYRLNQPLPHSVEKLSSTKPVPCAKNVGDHCLRRKEFYLSLTHSCRSFLPDQKGDSFGNSVFLILTKNMLCLHRLPGVRGWDREGSWVPTMFRFLI